MNQDELNSFTTKKLIEIINSLYNENSNLNNENSSLNNENSKLKTKIDILTEQLCLSKLNEFGQSSEKIINSKDPQVFDEPKEPEDKNKLDAADEEMTIPAHKRKKSKKTGRKPLPADLPREQVTYDLDETDKICNCGCKLTFFDTEVSERLEIIPAKIYVLQQIRNKYVCRECNSTIREAKLPPQPIPKSIAGPGVLAHTVVSKYEDHMPLYRQEQMYQRANIDIPRATMSNWMIKGYRLLRPLEKLLLENISSYDVAFADETKVQVLKEPGRKASQTSYMWVFGGGSPNKECCVYKYSPSRSHTVAKDALLDFEGYLHCDGYSGYDALSAQQKIIQVGCWYHCRRYFVKADKISKNKGLASWAVEQIAKIAKIEADIKSDNYTAKEKYDFRQQNALPILDEIFCWCERHLELVIDGSLIHKAIKYALNQQKKLRNYLLDGRLENNNNFSERLMKSFVIGRKNWLFCNSVAGANASSLYYSLIFTCKTHDINTFKWFKYVFKTIVRHESAY